MVKDTLLGEVPEKFCFSICQTFQLSMRRGKFPHWPNSSHVLNVRGISAIEEGDETVGKSLLFKIYIQKKPWVRNTKKLCYFFLKKKYEN